ncbi:hypothetical protein BU24DRAFT_497220 [Aaosphaeria arxii CBS 175.79]|uniref:Calycin-like protein n=1 Tax=Aaosphaeria arxii CBS 175.79 TaxID=1450172 RepID=A0A6A5X9I8_9PLEO|nr:uncharacterized protein BU24DRAFT_497220 [Aaosphaeria arxii CBS 175.79]KAF2009632.1 hypothetical protein BU24DRAFT_497220 [Aaosphaeria arxii CBS 175.79]
MAAPQDVTLKQLDGKWTLNKKLSGSTDPLLSLQGVNWVIRKAIGVTTITLDVSSYVQDDVLRIDIEQTSSSGMSGTTEKRVLDWSPQPQEDHIFGKCTVRTRLVEGIQQDGKTIPALEQQTPVSNEKVASFLKGLSLADGPSDGYLAGEEDIFVHFFVRHLEKDWTAEQIWGFEMIDDDRHWVRRVVVANVEGDFHEARLVYDFLGKK